MQCNQLCKICISWPCPHLLLLLKVYYEAKFSLVDLQLLVSISVHFMFMASNKANVATATHQSPQRSISSSNQPNKQPPPNIGLSSSSSKVNRLQVITGHLKTTPSATVAGEKVQKMPNNPLTSHVLDTTLGQPATNMNTILFKQGPHGEWVKLVERRTNNDGRLVNLLTDAEFTTGIYKFYFDTKSYYDNLKMKTFYPYVEIVFEIEHPTQHYHVPLLLSPFGYSTYRGS